jgi:hypothetical protein
MSLAASQLPKSSQTKEKVELDPEIWKPGWQTG